MESKYRSKELCTEKVERKSERLDEDLIYR